MPFATKSFLVGVLLIAGTATCLAAPPTGTACPRDMRGHPPANHDAVGLFYLNPADNMLQAPNNTNEKAGVSWRNVWTFKPGSASDFTAICSYDGTTEKSVFRLPASVTVCEQVPGAFSCR